MSLQGERTLTRAPVGAPYGLAIGRGGCVVPSGLHTAAAFATQSNGTDTSQTARWFIPLTDPAALHVLPVFANYWGSTTSDADPANAITIAAAIEMGDGSVVPFTFAGQHTVTLPGSGATFIAPDHPLFIGAQISATDTAGVGIACSGFNLRVYVSVSSGGKWQNNLARLASTDAYTTGAGADLTQAGSGSVSGGSYSYGYGPVAVLTRPHGSSRPPIVAAVTDSIFNGATDNPALWGPVARACAALRYPLVKCSRTGDYSLAAQSLSGYRYRGTLLDGCTHAIVELGTNDAQMTGASGITTMQSRLTAIGTMLRGMGIKPYLATIPPRTTTSDGWATTVNQTPVAGSQIGSLATMNQWIRTGPSPFFGFVDFAGAVSSGPDSGLWAPGSTGDGVHPTTATLASAVTPALQTLMSGWTV